STGDPPARAIFMLAQVYLAPRVILILFRVQTIVLNPKSYKRILYFSFNIYLILFVGTLISIPSQNIIYRVANILSTPSYFFTGGETKTYIQNFFVR
ncbi:hypothetical protein, partial [Geobacillus stearothermophilus]|uniref:hypothetical protein n=1 Tax=Geobacillus stearothermophilus TaxID=1422 RepID=UPI002E22C517|nr:hypothetical protein [Geobacillus stearothermophilus]